MGGKEEHSFSRESNGGMGAGCHPKPCQIGVFHSFSVSSPVISLLCLSSQYNHGQHFLSLQGRPRFDDKLIVTLILSFCPMKSIFK